MVKLTPSRWGCGRVPALLLHGFTGSRHSFDHLQPLLGGLLNATCVDLPGHRGAPLPRLAGSDEAAPTRGFEEVVDSIARLVRRPSVLIGYSQGARLALAVAVRHPGLARGLVLESVNPGLRRASDRLRRRQADEELATALLREGVEAFVERWERLPLFAGLQALPADARAALRARRTAHSAEGLAGALRCMGQGVQPDYWSALSGLAVPVLLLTGARDERYTRLARRAADRLPRAKRIALAGAGHAPHLERPRQYAAALRTFIAPWNAKELRA
ncbi:MAG: 2-succinyl-6-hydroxy-2,4-cyclohexadiene-1-carboxylate synthase [Myxococcales bacterium]